MFGKARERSPYFLAAVDFGYTLLAATGLYGYIGWWLDKKYQTTPFLLIGGIFLGLVVGFRSLFRRLNAIDSARRAAEAREKEHSPGPKS